MKPAFRCPYSIGVSENVLLVAIVVLESYVYLVITPGLTNADGVMDRSLILVKILYKFDDSSSVFKNTRFTLCLFVELDSHVTIQKS